MFSLISGKQFVLRLIFLAVIAGLFLVGLVWYNSHYDLFENFRPYYFRTYKEIVKYRLEIFRQRAVAFLGRGGSAVYERNTFLSDAPALSVPVLVYHGILSKPDRFAHTPEGFREDMLKLKEAGFQTIKLSDFLLFMHGKKRLPEKSFLLTFDDGRKDSFYPVDPILRDLNFNAVMFVATEDSLLGPQDSKYYLSVRELKNMVKTGRWEIGSHAVQKNGGTVKINPYGERGNFLSNLAWISESGRPETPAEFASRLKNELSDSKKQIEQTLGVSVIAFSYPFSDFGQQSKNFPSSREVIRDLVKQNYALAFYQTWPYNHGFSQNSVGDNPIYLRRIEPNPAWNGEFLVSLLDNGIQKDLPYNDNFVKNQGWRLSWGDYFLADNSLLVHAKPSTTGAFVLLDGSFLWKDYYFSAKADWLKGSHLSLVGRFHDEENYYSCNFSDQTVRVEKTQNGVTTLLGEYKNKSSLVKNELDFGLLVSGARIGCTLKDQVVAAGQDDGSSFPAGGIGFRSWDNQKNNSAARIKAISVKNLSLENNYPVRFAKLKK